MWRLKACRFHRSEETRKKISEAKRGSRNYFYGKHFTGSTNPNWKTDEWVEGLYALYTEGMPLADVAKVAGKSPATVVYHFKKRGYAYDGMKRLAEERIANRGPLWAGDGAGYSSLHSWVRRRLSKPSECPICGKGSRLELSNISGEYKRNLIDWVWVCRRCHMDGDGRLENLRQLSVPNYMNLERDSKGRFTKCVRGG